MNVLLHTHSHFSLLSALPKIPELISAAKKKGFKSVALTDLGNLYGAIEFYKECKSQEMNPIIGAEMYTAARTRHDRQHNIDNRRGRIILLAENEDGYKNLIKIVTTAHLEGFYYRPRVDFEVLEKYKQGIIAISPSYGGDIQNALRSKNEELAEKLAKRFLSIFGADNFFLELTRHPESPTFQVQDIEKFAEKANISLVAGSDIYYLDESDKQAHDTLMSIQNNPDYGELSVNENGIDLSMPSAKKINDLFKKHPEAMRNSETLANRCKLELKLGQWYFPEIKIESGLSPDDELKRIVYEGIPKRGLAKTKEVTERVEYELKVIREKGYAKYFLVVADLLRYAHEHGILTTIRGSVGGSLVTYLAFITNVDPLVYNIPFERFLNPERPSAPDIDMDYADNRRDEIIEYTKQKYGQDRVAQIGTFGTILARGSVRDVARALGHDYSVGDMIAKLIPMGSQGFPMTIEKALELVPELKKLVKNDKAARDIIAMAKKIEGCARHISVHAAGVVISPTPLTDFTPLQFDPKGEGKIITQYDMYSVDENSAGLLKFDFLGIRNLSILADAVKLVKTIEGVDIDIENIPLNDKKTFEMLARGETVGLFQLNGQAMTQFLTQLEPTDIRDINVMVALYRPGPMRNIPEYIDRKKGKKKIVYLHPKMEKYLAESYGILVYQEDIMMTALELAGYTWKTVDKLRKAIGKKIPAEMAEQHEVFVKGCQKVSGIPEAKAEEIWNLFEPFQGYGFNKAHAASYGKVAYQTAYMKANYPAIYMSSVLTAESGDVEKIGEVIAECKRMKIPVLPPDINKSFEGFTVIKKDTGDEIRFGLSTIKNFGDGVSQSIIAERKKGGEFSSLGEFLERIQDRNLNKKSLESLIKCGAMDCLGSTTKTSGGVSVVERGAMLGNLEQLLEYHRDHAQGAKDQTSLFGDSSVSNLRLSPAPEASAQEKLAWEKELLGLYISGHPLDKFKAILEKRDVNIKKVKEEYKEGMQVVIGGILEELKPIITKNKEQMAFLRLADLSDSIEAVVFPRTFSEEKDKLKSEACLAVKGRVSVRNGEKSLIIEKVKSLESPAV